MSPKSIIQSVGILALFTISQTVAGPKVCDKCDLLGRGKPSAAGNLEVLRKVASQFPNDELPVCSDLSRTEIYGQHAKNLTVPDNGAVEIRSMNVGKEEIPYYFKGTKFEEYLIQEATKQMNYLFEKGELPSERIDGYKGLFSKLTRNCGGAAGDVGLESPVDRRADFNGPQCILGTLYGVINGSYSNSDSNVIPDMDDSVGQYEYQMKTDKGLETITTKGQIGVTPRYSAKAFDTTGIVMSATIPEDTKQNKSKNQTQNSNRNLYRGFSPSEMKQVIELGEMLAPLKSGKSKIDKQPQNYYGTLVEMDPIWALTSYAEGCDQYDIFQELKLTARTKYRSTLRLLKGSASDDVSVSSFDAGKCKLVISDANTTNEDTRNSILPKLLRQLTKGYGEHLKQAIGSDVQSARYKKYSQFLSSHWEIKKGQNASDLSNWKRKPGARFLSDNAKYKPNFEINEAMYYYFAEPEVLKIVDPELFNKMKKEMFSSKEFPDGIDFHDGFPKWAGLSAVFDDQKEKIMGACKEDLSSVKCTFKDGVVSLSKKPKDWYPSPSCAAAFNEVKKALTTPPYTAADYCLQGGEPTIEEGLKRKVFWAFAENLPDETKQSCAYPEIKSVTPSETNTPKK